MERGRKALLGGAVLFCMFAGAALVLSAPDGAKLFESEGCIQCHSFRGRGGFMGPDLTAVSQRRSKGWIREQIKDPKRHNPASAMPSFDHLSRREVNAIISYLDAKQ